MEARYQQRRGRSPEGRVARDHIFFLAGCDAGGGGDGGCLVRRVKVGQRWVAAIIDMGATINVIGEKRLESVQPRPSVRHPDIPIWRKEPIAHHGNGGGRGTVGRLAAPCRISGSPESVGHNNRICNSSCVWSRDCHQASPTRARRKEGLGRTNNRPECGRRYIRMAQRSIEQIL